MTITFVRINDARLKEMVHMDYVQAHAALLDRREVLAVDVGGATWFYARPR